MSDVLTAEPGDVIEFERRVCEHEYFHPDPDDLQFKMSMMDWMTVEAISSVHLVSENCDGCCDKKEY